MTITYADGTPVMTADTQDEALDLIARRYSVSPADLVTHEDCGERPRTLVWTSEEDAQEDDGAHAVAEIR
jgi:hypothetical protein